MVWLGLTVFVPATKPANCIATTADGTDFSLALDQAGNAATISAVTTSRGLSARTVTIALATAMQESKLRNLDYGHSDSLGLFQQRPSQGWGTEAEIMDPVYATNAFLDVLITIDGYETMPLTEAAQRVQRSAYPDAYAQHEQRADAFAQALAGAVQEALTCSFSSVEPSSDLAGRVNADWQGTLSATVTGSEATIDVGPYAPWAVAQYAVAIAHSTGVTVVVVGDREWRPTWGEWRDARTPAPDGVVQLTLR